MTHFALMGQRTCGSINNPHEHFSSDCVDLVLLYVETVPRPRKQCWTKNLSYRQHKSTPSFTNQIGAHNPLNAVLVLLRVAQALLLSHLLLRGWISIYAKFSLTFYAYQHLLVCQNTNNFLYFLSL